MTTTECAGMSTLLTCKKIGISLDSLRFSKNKERNGNFFRSVDCYTTNGTNIYEN